jgi:hypothetical protein
MLLVRQDICSIEHLHDLLSPVDLPALARALANGNATEFGIQVEYIRRNQHLVLSFVENSLKLSTSQKEHAYSLEAVRREAIALNNCVSRLRLSAASRRFYLLCVEEKYQEMLRWMADYCWQVNPELAPAFER